MGLFQYFFPFNQKLFTASSLLQVSLICLTVNMPSVLPSAIQWATEERCFCYPNLTGLKHLGRVRILIDILKTAARSKVWCSEVRKMSHASCAAWGENMYLSALTGGEDRFFFFFLIRKMTSFMISLFFGSNASFGSNPNVSSSIIALCKIELPTHSWLLGDT